MHWQSRCEGTGERASRCLVQALEEAGLSVYRSFSLCEALHVLPGCGCACRGTPECACHYTILLVYDRISPPALMIAHHRDNVLELEIRGQPAAVLEAALESALIGMGAVPVAADKDHGDLAGVGGISLELA